MGYSSDGLFGLEEVGEDPMNDGDNLQGGIEDSMDFTVDGEIGGLISQEDADYAGELLDPGTSAALLVWEDPWA